MPGTLMEIASKTGFPIPVVLRHITMLREQGVVVVAVRGEIDQDNEDDLRQKWTPTTFVLDAASREE
jgi:DNA-binding transcriptional regulator LsrR (DeoR family)